MLSRLFRLATSAVLCVAFTAAAAQGKAIAATARQDEVAAMQVHLNARERKVRTQNEIKVASLTVSDGDHRRSSTPPVSLESRAQDFLADYGRRVQADASDALAFYRENFADKVHYYGERISNRELLAEQRSFLARWPHRRYRIRSDATHIACNDARSYCDVSGKYDFRLSGRHRASRGVATFAFRVVFTPGGPKVVSQNGRVLSQR